MMGQFIENPDTPIALPVNESEHTAAKVSTIVDAILELEW
jgi:hypothetical protein